MPEIPESVQQRMLIPVLIGGAVMALVSYLPFVQYINFFCCAGIMGGAVLGVWFYKKSYPADLAFGPKQGAMIGALSGVVGAVLYALLVITMYSSFSDEFLSEFNTALEKSRSELEAQGQDPAAVEKASEIITSVVESPFMMFAVTLGFSLLAFAGFGAIGGAIGGKIFRASGTDPTRPPVEGGAP